MGERLRVEWDVAGLPARAIVPSLLLQPLLENAIGHGIEPLPAGGTVTVQGWVDGDTVVLEVANPVPADGAGSTRRGNRMALDNVRQRLGLAFPGRSGVDVQEGDGRFRVRLWFPLVVHERSDDAGAASPPPDRVS